MEPLFPAQEPQMRKLFPLLVAAVLSVPAFAQASRHFTFHYGFTVRNVAPGQKLEVWFPQAHSDAFQEVRVVSASGDLPLTTARDARYGNTMYHAITPNAVKPEYSFEVVYDVVRRERIGRPRDGVSRTWRGFPSTNWTKLWRLTSWFRWAEN